MKSGALTFSDLTVSAGLRARWCERVRAGGGVGADFRPLGAVRIKIVLHCRRTAGRVYDQGYF